MHLPYYYIIHIEQNIDGETLVMVAEQRSIDQIKAYGFATVADQMRLRKLVQTQDSKSVGSSYRKDITTPARFSGRSGVARPGPTRACALPSTSQALPSPTQLESRDSRTNQTKLKKYIFILLC